MMGDGHTIFGVNSRHILLRPLRGANYRTEDLAIIHISLHATREPRAQGKSVQTLRT